MSGQQHEQRAAHLPGSLGHEVAQNEERGEERYEGFNRPSAAQRSEGTAEGGGEPYTRQFSGTEEEPTPRLNVDPVRQNVAYVYPSADDAPGSKDDVNVVHSEPEQGMEGRGEAAIRVGPGLSEFGTGAMPKGSVTGSGRGYDRGTEGYDTREGAVRREGPGGPEDRVHVSGKDQPKGYLA